jgi:hypothetical protein
MGAYAYLDALDADALGGTDVKAGLPAYVKEHYGGGEYRFEIRGPVGKGRIKGYRGGDSFSVDKTIPPKYPHEPEIEVTRGGASTPNSTADMLQSAVLTLVMDLVRQSGESQKLQNELTRASIDQLRANMHPAREERDPLEMFKAMAEIMRPAQVAADPIEQLNKVLELQERLGGGTREPSAMGVIADLGPQLLGTLNKALDQRKPGGPPPVTIHDPDGTVVAHTPASAPGSASAGQPQPEGAAVLQLLGRWVPYLTKWAEQDRDPGWAAGTIFWEVPAGYHAALRAKLEPEDAVTQIVAGFPALAPFAGWLAELRVELLASLNAQDGSGTPDDPSGG